MDEDEICWSSGMSLKSVLASALYDRLYTLRVMAMACSIHSSVQPKRRK